MSTFCILWQGDTEVWRVILFWSKQNTDRCSLTPEMRRLMISRELRQQTGGDNRSHALVTEVSCVTRSSWQSRDNSGSNLVSIIGSFLGVKGQHYYCLIVKIKSQENTNSQTVQDNGQTSVNINRQTVTGLTQVWLCDSGQGGGMSDCWSVEVTVTSWHHDIRVMVTRMSWGPVSRSSSVTKSRVHQCQSVQHLDTWEPEQVFSQPGLSPGPGTWLRPDIESWKRDWILLDIVCMAPVTWPLLCPAGGGVSILCVF